MILSTCPVKRAFIPTVMRIENDSTNLGTGAGVLHDRSPAVARIACDRRGIASSAGSEWDADGRLSPAGPRFAADAVAGIAFANSTGMNVGAFGIADRWVECRIRGGIDGASRLMDNRPLSYLIASEPAGFCES